MISASRNSLCRCLSSKFERRCQRWVNSARSFEAADALTDIFTRNEPDLTDLSVDENKKSNFTARTVLSSLKELLLASSCDFEEFQENLAYNESMPIGSPLDLLSLTAEQIKAVVSVAVKVSNVGICSILIEKWRKTARELCSGERSWLASYRTT
jgi:hypothetical protein